MRASARTSASRASSGRDLAVLEAGLQEVQFSLAAAVASLAGQAVRLGAVVGDLGDGRGRGLVQRRVTSQQGGLGEIAVRDDGLAVPRDHLVCGDDGVRLPVAVVREHEEHQGTLVPVPRQEGRQLLVHAEARIQEVGADDEEGPVRAGYGLEDIVAPRIPGQDVPETRPERFKGARWTSRRSLIGSLAWA